MALITQQAIAADADSIQLRSLSSNQAKSWSRSESAGAELFLLFQDNCLSCRKQSKQLSCLESEGVRIRFIAQNKSLKSLREEAQRMGALDRAYAVSLDDLKKLQFTEPATPQGLLFQGKKSVKWLGTKSCAEIREQLNRGSKVDEAA